MTITLFIGSLKIGGAERQITLLAKGLAKKGHKVNVVTIFPGGELEEELLSCPEITLSSLWSKRSKRMFVRIFQLILSPLILRKHIKGSDVLYSMLETSNFIAWLATRWLKKPCLIWGIRSSKMEGHWKMAFFEKLCAIVSPTVNLVIANSNAGVKDMLARGYKPKKYIVIHNGIDIERFRFDKKAREDFRAKIGVSSNQKLIGIVGRLDPMKDHYTFLQAAALVLQNLKNVKFLCVGDGPSHYAKKLKELSKKLGIENKVIWLGAQKDMPTIYSALDLLVSSSYGEGFSNVIGEAMACGVPCIVTDVGDSALIVGNMGIVVPPKDPQKLAQAIVSLLKGNINKTREAIRKRIVENFSLQIFIDKTEKALISCIKKC